VTGFETTGLTLQVKPSKSGILTKDLRCPLFIERTLVEDWSQGRESSDQ